MAKIIKITNEEALLYFDKIIEFIKKQKKGFFVMKKLKGVHGYCNWDEGIVIDYRKEFIPTIIHECIHCIEFDWTEHQVLYVEKRIINTVSEDDISKLLMYFVKKL